MSDSRHSLDLVMVGYLVDPLVESPSNPELYTGNVFTSPAPTPDPVAIYFKVNAPKAAWNYPGTENPMPEGALLRIHGTGFSAANGQLRCAATEIEFLGWQDCDPATSSGCE